MSQFHWNLALRLGLPIEKSLPFHCAVVPDTDSGSLFHFAHHSGMGDNISHTVTGWFLQYLAKWLTPTTEWIHYRYILGLIRQTTGSGYRLICKQGCESRITCAWDYSLGSGALSEHSLVLAILWVRYGETTMSVHKTWQHDCTDNRNRWVRTDPMRPTMWDSEPNQQCGVLTLCDQWCGVLTITDLRGGQYFLKNWLM